MQGLNHESLAQHIADRAFSQSGRSGIFVCAQFATSAIKFELIKEIELRAAQIIYVELNGNADDPGEVTCDAIRMHLCGRIDCRALGFDIEEVGLGRTVTLSSALEALSDTTKSEIVLVIDGIERTQDSQMGISLMFALKATRDNLNASAHHGFRLIGFGKDRDILAKLVHLGTEAFFCARLIEL